MTRKELRALREIKQREGLYAQDFKVNFRAVREGLKAIADARDGMKSALIHLRRYRVLDKREYAVLKARFVENKNLLEVAKGMGVTRERVRQVEDKALVRLKELDPLHL